MAIYKTVKLANVPSLCHLYSDKNVQLQGFCIPVPLIFRVCFEVEFACAWVLQTEHMLILSTLWGGVCKL